MKGWDIFEFLILLILFFPAFMFAQGETLTITTYYPSPYGSYNELQLYPHSTPVTACNSNTRGTMYYDSDDSQIYICNGSIWTSLAGYWTLSGTNLYPNNTNWNVGIGTTNPTNGKLQVSGGSGFGVVSTTSTTDPDISAVFGWNYGSGVGTYGGSQNGRGVVGDGPDGGVVGYGGLAGDPPSGTGVAGYGSSYGVYGIGPKSYFSGNVGIGTTNPGAKLEVSEGWFWTHYNTQSLPSSSGSGGLVVGWNKTGGAAEVNLYNVYNNATTSFNFSQKTGASTATDLLTIKGSGNVGIGTTSPRSNAPNGVTTGNLDTNDVWLRGANRWASQSGVHGQSSCVWQSRVACPGVPTQVCPDGYYVAGVQGSCWGGDLSGFSLYCCRF